MRLLWIVGFVAGAFGADTDPREIVRKAVLNDRAESAGIAKLYSFTESARTQNLDDKERRDPSPAEPARCRWRISSGVANDSSGRCRRSPRPSISDWWVKRWFAPVRST